MQNLTKKLEHLEATVPTLRSYGAIQATLL